MWMPYGSVERYVLRRMVRICISNSHLELHRKHRNVAYPYTRAIPIVLFRADFVFREAVYLLPKLAIWPPVLPCGLLDKV